MLLCSELSPRPTPVLGLPPLGSWAVLWLALSYLCVSGLMGCVRVRVHVRMRAHACMQTHTARLLCA